MRSLYRQPLKFREILPPNILRGQRLDPWRNRLVHSTAISEMQQKRIVDEFENMANIPGGEQYKDVPTAIILANSGLTFP